LRHVSNRCYERFIGNLGNYFDDGSVMVFDWLNIDFTGTYRRNLYRIIVQNTRFLLGFGSSSSKKNVSVIIGSLEDSTMFLIICFSGSIIGEVSLQYDIFLHYTSLQSAILSANRITISLVIFSRFLLLSISTIRGQLITSRYCKIIKSFSVSPISKRTDLVNH